MRDGEHSLIEHVPDLIPTIAKGASVGCVQRAEAYRVPRNRRKAGVVARLVFVTTMLRLLTAAEPFSFLVPFRFWELVLASAVSSSASDGRELKRFTDMVIRQSEEQGWPRSGEERALIDRCIGDRLRDYYKIVLREPLPVPQRQAEWTGDRRALALINRRDDPGGHLSGGRTHRPLTSFLLLSANCHRRSRTAAVNGIRQSRLPRRDRRVAICAPAANQELSRGATGITRIRSDPPD